MPAVGQWNASEDNISIPTSYGYFPFICRSLSSKWVIGVFLFFPSLISAPEDNIPNMKGQET